MQLLMSNFFQKNLIRNLSIEVKNLLSLTYDFLCFNFSKKKFDQNIYITIDTHDKIVVFPTCC